MRHKVNEKFFLQVIDKKSVIFDTNEMVYFTFNETASFIFNKIKAGENENKIINSLVKKYQIPSEKAKVDLLNLLEVLKKMKIIFA